MINVQLLGAAGEVTGSAYLITTQRSKVLVDFGLHQGGHDEDERNRDALPFKPQDLSAVVLTHAHLDHSGRLPLLRKQGFKGNILCTEPTIRLSDLILSDAAFQQQNHAEREIRYGKDPLEVSPLYLPEDVLEILPTFQAVDYNERFAVTQEMTGRFQEAGHILGAASLELTVKAAGKTKTIIFSGDIGQYNMPIHPDPMPFSTGDLVFLESTYGDRNHQSLDSTLGQFADVLNSTISRRAKILIPAFAVGRTQQLIYYLREFIASKRIKPVPIYIDSPMATKATNIYLQNLDLFDQAAKRVIQHNLPGDVRFISSAEESKRLNSLAGPLVIIAGAGMCTGGRILHHFRHNLTDANTSVVICGYQAHGTLGRRLVDGIKDVKIFGQPIEVLAKVHTIGGFSAHAGQGELVKWFEKVAPAKPKLALTHGEDKQRQTLRDLIKNKFSIEALLPKRFDSITLE